MEKGQTTPGMGIPPFEAIIPQLTGYEKKTAISKTAQKGGRAVSNITQFRSSAPRGLPSCMSASEVAYELGVSTQKVYLMLRNGELPCKRAGKRWLIPREAFHQWLRKDVQGK